MVASVGNRIPDVEVQVLGEDGFPKPVRTGEALGTGRVVLFSVPGAFTPGCTHIHLPGFINGYDDLAAKGVDKVACVAVNDPWVMEAWAEATGSGDILMLSDGNGDFAVAMELSMDATGFGLGIRSQRYAAVLQDGVIEALRVEQGPGIDVSSCIAVLEIL